MDSPAIPAGPVPRLSGISDIPNPIPYPRYRPRGGCGGHLRTCSCRSAHPLSPCFLGHLHYDVARRAAASHFPPRNQHFCLWKPARRNIGARSREIWRRRTSRRHARSIAPLSRRDRCHRLPIPTTPAVPGCPEIEGMNGGAKKTRTASTRTPNPGKIADLPEKSAKRRP